MKCNMIYMEKNVYFRIFKGAAKLKPQIIFVSATKIVKKHNKQFGILFFMISLHFGTSNYLYTGKQVYFFKNSFHLILPFLESQRRLIQTKYAIYKAFLLCLKTNDSQTLKIATAKTFSAKCMLLILVIYKLLR